MGRPAVGEEASVELTVTSDMTAIVVLGSGSFTVHGAEEHVGVLDLAGAARVLEAAYVYRLIGSPWVISSGGQSFGRPQ